MPRALNWRAASSSSNSRWLGRAGALASCGRGARVRLRPAAALPLPARLRCSDIFGCNHNRTSNRLTSRFDEVLASHTEVSNWHRAQGQGKWGWAMSHANRTKNYKRIGLGTLGLLAGASVLAADNSADTAEVPTIGEIVVTAQRREESNLKVGLTLTALSGDAIAQQRIEQVLDLKG